MSKDFLTFVFLYLYLQFKIVFREILLEETIAVSLLFFKDPMKFDEQILYSKLMKLLDEENKMLDFQGK